MEGYHSITTVKLGFLFKTLGYDNKIKDFM